jgi:alpha-glucosidase
MQEPWWRRAVFYQVYIRSFADLGGDGIGDLQGIRSRLEYLSWLGVDAIWITPFFRSPQADHGYDVSDFRDVDPLFGTLADFDALLEDAHGRGIRVVCDIVPNHTSNKHPWFLGALTSRDHPDRNKYIFRDPKPDGSPPNNWGSVFGGPAWTFHEGTRQYFLHLFASEQPDLNWRNPEVPDEFEQILRFWFDRGVDGFRIDVAHGLFKDEHLRDNPESPHRQRGTTAYHSLEQVHTFDQEEVHDVFRKWRPLADSYSGDRVLIGEVFLFDPVKVARYVRPDELHLAFNFLLLGTPWDATKFKSAIDQSSEEIRGVAATSSWVLSNHDVVRHATRYGGGELGRQRARAAALILLGLPGVAFVYSGDELGLEQADVPDDRRQDPVFFRTNGAMEGRDGCRIPIPWNEEPPAFGFSTAEPWLPMPEDWGRRSVEVERTDEDSMLHLYRKTLELRKKLLASSPDLQWLTAPPEGIAFAVGGLAVACNFSDGSKDFDLPGKLAISSDVESQNDGRILTLPGNSAAWVETG